MTILKNIETLFSPDFRHSLSVTKIQGDASSRQYFRVKAPDGSFVACHDPAYEASPSGNYPFLVVHDLFSQHSIAVPQLIALNPEKGLLLLEDCGDQLLQNIFGSPAEHSIPALYREIIDVLTEIQAISGPKNTIPFSISFDREKLMAEFDFFIEHGLLNYFAAVFDRQLIGQLRFEFEAIAELLLQPSHFVLNHRDFHSRNILLHRDKPVIIDFQDARMGLPQYDAVSLLRDSYIRIDTSLLEELKRYHYNALCSHNLCTMSFDEYLFYFDIMAFQRNIKAIGTFCFQTIVKKNNTFEHSIAPTLDYIPDYIEARAELGKAGEILHPLLEGRAS